MEGERKRAYHLRNLSYRGNEIYPTGAQCPPNRAPLSGLKKRIERKVSTGGDGCKGPSSPLRGIMHLK